MMRDGQIFLLLRYSQNYKHDCIEEHYRILQEKGYCWFGKIGSIPSEGILKAVFSENVPVMILYRKDAAFITEVSKYSTERPEAGVPDYYDLEGIQPSIYFCIKSIVECDSMLFHNSIVISTGAYVDDVVYHSRIPFMLCKYIDESLQAELGVNECRYRKDEFCNCRSCVNYNCFCERPSSCSKQRR